VERSVVEGQTASALRPKITRPKPSGPLEEPLSTLGKFTRPRPVGALERTRLFCALDEARRHPAVWIVGPPGAGKTTLASTYVEQRRLRTLWYRVHDDDADPATFFHYFGLAVEAAAPGGRKIDLPHLTPEYLLNLPVFSRRYFERVHQSLPAPCTLVFDNYQEAAQDAALHEVMREVLQSLPAGINVIALSRAEPPPALAPLRASGTLVLLGAEELKLTACECNEIAQLRKVRIEPQALQRLYARTQGWTAGVVLALEQKGPPEGAAVLAPEATPQVVFDYFAGEIFGRMARETQALLVQAAFLPSMAAHRVVELTGAPEAGCVLEELNRRNYFTLKLAQAHPAAAVYQFHPLFREFLLRRAQETLAPGALAQLRKKSAALLEADGETYDAVALLIAAQTWDEALRVMFAHAQEMLQQGRGRVLETWLRALPDALRSQTPWALYWLGMCRLAFDPVEARRHLERAFHLFERGSESTGLFAAWAGIIETFVYEWGDFAPLDRWIGVLDELLARHPGFPTPQIEARVASGMFVAIMYRQPQRPDLPQWAERMRTLVLNASDVRTQMTLGNQLVHYYNSWLGDLASTRLLLEAVRRPANAADVGPLAHIAWRGMEAGYYWYMAEHEECLRAANDGLETARQIGARFMNTLLLSHGLIGSLTAGDFTTAARLLKDVAAMMAGGRRLDRAHYHFLVFLDAFYRKDSLHALTSAREAVALGDAAGVPFSECLFRLGLAHALFGCGQRREALRYLAQAQRIARRTRIANVEFGCLYSAIFFALERGKLRLALPLLRKMLESAKRQGYVNRLFWTPEIMTRLLAAALEHGIEVQFVQALIRKRKLAPPPEAVHLEHWPFPVRIYTLGRFSVLLDGQPLQFSGKAQRKPLELLTALVAFGGRDVGEQQLTEALWPDAEGDAAHQACAAALHRLRKLLGCDEAISLQRNRFSLDPRYVWVDVWAFERGLAAEQESSGAAGRSASDRVLALYQGPFLGKDVDLPCAIPLRERLRAKFLRYLIQRSQDLLGAGDFKPAIAVLEKGLNVDPLAEDCYHTLMLCYQALNRRAEAIGVYRRCEKTLTATLGVSPAPQIVALYRTLQR
jgi:LuxR family transcriptional regulator, maltose regulon positive regulatory protein